LLPDNYAEMSGIKRRARFIELERGNACVDKRVNNMNYKDIITIEPDKRGGKPCIRGLRITVYDVLEYLASGMTPEEILEDFDYLTIEDIQACLSYAADRERHQLIVGA
jgi:uncharacterized protein (DUF433 family)